MLIGISPLLSPELLAELCRMGHGDEIVLADAHFPGHSVSKNVLRADGLKIPDLLAAILPLFALDAYCDSPVFMMQVEPGDRLDLKVEKRYRAVIDKFHPGTPGIKRVQRQAFYEQSRRAYLVVMTGDTTPYGNIILKKGVTPVKK